MAHRKTDLKIANMKNWESSFYLPLLLMGIVLLVNNCKKDKSDPIITWSNPADISYGTLLSETQLDASSDVPGEFIFTPPIGTKLGMGSNQDLKVEFTPSDGESYNNVSKTVKINVTKPVITFNSDLTYGSLTDQDGNVYKTITIGTQTWMAENLRTTKYKNGEPISQVTDNSAWSALTSGAYCNIYNTNDYDTISTFGRLYNWYAATDSRSIAPEGWHVPSNSDWNILKSYLGNTYPNNKLKEASMAHWALSINDDDNSSGFTAFPCGFRYEDNGQFTIYENNAYWLSTTEVATSSCILWLYDGSQLIEIEPASRIAGWSIRCVKD